jgi:hypothetical protein
MSAATIAIPAGERYERPHQPLSALLRSLRARFYRFLENLPERYPDVDPEVLKRVPVPI